jgi:hypothetical protein
MAWPDFHTRSEGRLKMEDAGAAMLLGRSDIYLLHPLTPARLAAD